MNEVINKTQAGFPSPAQEHITNRIDLNEILIKHPVATFFLTVKGYSMENAGISDGDHLIVDRALTANHNNIVIAEIDGEITVKRLYKRNGIIKLKAENITYPDIVPQAGQLWSIWGVVTYIIKAAQ